MYEVLRETYAHADLAPDVLRKGAISKNGQTERMGGWQSKTASKKSAGTKSNESNLISVIRTLNSQLIACKEVGCLCDVPSVVFHPQCVITRCRCIPRFLAVKFIYIYMVWSFCIPHNCVSHGEGVVPYWTYQYHQYAWT